MSPPHSYLYSSPPKSPPPFSKAESRFEREQRIKVGSLDSFTPGGTLERKKSLSPPPGVSTAQQRADRERFRVEPGRIENYTIGKGSLAQQESYKVSPEFQSYYTGSQACLAYSERASYFLAKYFASSAMLQAGLARSSTGGLEAEGCGITKYSSAHSFNPLLASKSTQNLSVKKVDFSPEKIP